jgi:hypothetical protein
MAKPLMPWLKNTEVEASVKKEVSAAKMVA